MSTPMEQIKERVGIVDVVGSYLKLERAGSSFKAKCPFHNEKTPSFFVSPARNSFYCFGCNKGGNIFSFVQEFEGLDFVGALRVLAQRAGVELRRVDPKVRSEYARLYLLLEKATRFFEAELAKNEEARTYLLDRGLAAETVKNWRLGFAPNDWRQLHDHLLKEGFTPAEMGKVGLIKHKEAEFLSSSPPLQRGEKRILGASQDLVRPSSDAKGVQLRYEGAESAKRGGGEGTANIRYYDTFRGRIMFPIFDGAARVIAFSGRILPRLDDGKTGKYINSPETVLFRKSETLHGFHVAKLPIRQKDAAILVEGQMDLLMAHQAGYANTVASSGTALSEPQLQRLKRLSENLLIAFDSDSAGLNASERAIRLALALGMNVQVIALKDLPAGKAGKDPAEIILHAPTEWERAVKNSKHIIDFLLDNLLASAKEGRERALAIEKDILPFLRLLSSSVEQSHFIKAIAEKSDLRENALWESFRKLPVLKRTSDSPRTSDSRVSQRSGGAARSISLVLAYLRSKPEWSAEAVELEQKTAKAVGQDFLTTQFSAFQNEMEALLHEGEARYGGEKPPPRELEELLNLLEEEHVSRALEAKLTELAAGERAKDAEATARLLAECKSLSDRLSSLKAERFRK